MRTLKSRELVQPRSSGGWSAGAPSAEVAVLIPSWASELHPLQLRCERGLSLELGCSEQLEVGVSCCVLLCAAVGYLPRAARSSQ